jgi:hypothetical protein
MLIAIRPEIAPKTEIEYLLFSDFPARQEASFEPLPAFTNWQHVSAQSCCKQSQQIAELTLIGS